MLWIIFALGAALAWGLYGPALHSGQVALGSPMRALLCVGVAYFLIGVLVPIASLTAQGDLQQGFTMKGAMGATLGEPSCNRRGLYYFRFQIRRPSNLRDAFSFRGGASRECNVFDVGPSSQDCA